MFTVQQIFCSSVMPHSVEKEFTFSFGSKEGRSKLTVPVTIPLISSTTELVEQLHKMHNLPCYIIGGMPLDNN